MTGRQQSRIKHKTQQHKAKKSIENKKNGPFALICIRILCVPGQNGLVPLPKRNFVTFKSIIPVLVSLLANLWKMYSSLTLWNTESLNRWLDNKTTGSGYQTQWTFFFSVRFKQPFIYLEYHILKKGLGDKTTGQTHLPSSASFLSMIFK